MLQNITIYKNNTTKYDKIIQQNNTTENETTKYYNIQKNRNTTKYNKNKIYTTKIILQKYIKVQHNSKQIPQEEYNRKNNSKRMQTITLHKKYKKSTTKRLQNGILRKRILQMYTKNTKKYNRKYNLQHKKQI